MKKEESFEELLNRLEDITTKLEKEENISLEESMKLFEEGIEISKKCNKQIEEAERKISILIRENNFRELLARQMDLRVLRVLTVCVCVPEQGVEKLRNQRSEGWQW